MNGSGGQAPPGGSDSEEAERCPICLCVLAGGELAMPDSCCHVFCLGCLVTWAELQMSPSCPVDRRPFTDVYRWDGNHLVQVPVTKRSVQVEADSLCSRKLRQKICLKSNTTKTQRQQNTKTKGPVRKCNEEDPSSFSRKKVRGTDCCARSPPPCVSFTTQDIAEPTWVAEDLPHGSGLEQCKPQRCPWLLPAHHSPVDVSLRQRFHSSGSSSNSFPFGLAPFATSSPFSSGHFVFQGVVCAVTCPKGGEKRGGRSSASKAPTKESGPSRRSGRGSKTEEESPAPEAASPSQRGDSDSSSGQVSKPATSSQAEVKRKGKRVTNRKAGGKRKAAAKKPTAEVRGSPAPSDKEEESDGGSEEAELKEKSTEQTEEENSDLQRTTSVDSEENQEEPEGEEENYDTGKVRLSSQSESAPTSPVACSEDFQETEEEPASPASPEKRTSLSPSPFAQEVLENERLSPLCEETEEPQDDVDAESAEDNADEPSKETVSGFSDGTVQAAPPSEESVTESTEKPSDPDVKTEKPEAPSTADRPHEDDTSVIPMDCSSPLSEQNTPPPDPVSSLPERRPTPARDERERSEERKNGKQRRSRFHSATSTWSPQRDAKRERDGRPAPPRGRDGEREHHRSPNRRERSRERRRRRSRSRSRSRTRCFRRAPSPDRPSREESPPRKERRGGGWRSGPDGPGSEGRRHHGGAGRFENGAESSPDRQGWSENPDWVTEKSRVDGESRNWDSGFGSSWDEQQRSGGGDGREARGRGRGGRAGRGFYNQPEDAADNRWTPRNFSGTGNHSGGDSYGRGRKKDSEPAESMVDRSGWSSASSWAVRRTLPADVQDYYSKRERGGAGSWNRSEEEQQGAATDPPKTDPPAQVVAGNAPAPVVNVLPPQLSVLHHPYSIQNLQGALPVGLQPAAPYAMHLHPVVPLLQVPAVSVQSLPPPPPPPPPMQAGGQSAAAQPDGLTTQMPNTVMAYGKPGLLPTPTKASIAMTTQPAPTQVLPSSTTQHNKAQADSSKKEKKQQIQEKAINEVKTAIKPFYQKKEISKEEYKEIVRKAVEKVCHSKSGEVNASKVANLVKAYVDKYKRARKK